MPKLCHAMTTPPTHKLAIAAGEVEYEGFGKLTRVEETIMFAKKMGAKNSA